MNCRYAMIHIVAIAYIVKNEVSYDTKTGLPNNIHNVSQLMIGYKMSGTGKMRYISLNDNSADMS